MTDSEARFAIDRSRVISEVLDGEAIIIDSRTGAYFSLDPNGTAVWEALDAPGADAPVGTDVAVGALSMAEVATAAGVEPSVVASVLGELCAAELIMVWGAAPPVDTAVSPSLTEYRDMEALLLLDPIHDVDAAGWPIARDGD